MVAFGPWVQDPDYLRVVSWDIDDQVDTLAKQGLTRHSGGSLLSEETSEDPPPPFPTVPYEQLGTMLSTALNMNEDDSPGVEPGGVSLRYGTAVVLLKGRGQSEVRASAARVPLVPGEPAESEATGWRPFTYIPQEWPEDAIDIEYEDGDLAEWLTAEIAANTELYGNVFEDITGTHDLNQARVSRPFTSEIRVAPGWPGASMGTSIDVFETGPADYDPDSGVAGSAGRLLGHTVPLSEHVEPSGGVMWLWTPDFVPASIVPDGSSGSWRWSYGWGFERLRLSWILRPPRYRWVYDSVPYRRITQRGDSLAGGARRIGGRVKTIQGSNRRGAGSVV